MDFNISIRYQCNYSKFASDGMTPLNKLRIHLCPFAENRILVQFMTRMYERGESCAPTNSRFQRMMGNLPRSEIQQALFPTASEIRFRFSKMAIDETEGHFDVHRDTVRSHDHQGTLLIEVRSVHTGGDLVLENNGEECHLLFQMMRVESSPITFQHLVQESIHN